MQIGLTPFPDYVTHLNFLKVLRLCIYLVLDIVYVPVKVTCALMCGSQRISCRSSLSTMWVSGIQLRWLHWVASDFRHWAAILPSALFSPLRLLGVWDPDQIPLKLDSHTGFSTRFSYIFNIVGKRVSVTTHGGWGFQYSLSKSS